MRRLFRYIGFGQQAAESIQIPYPFLNYRKQFGFVDLPSGRT
jgi:hypothetical protein